MVNDAAISLIRRLVDDVDVSNNSSTNGEVMTTTTATTGCLTTISSSRNSSRNDSITTTMIINEMRDFLLLLDETVHSSDNEIQNDNGTDNNNNTGNDTDDESDDSQNSQSLEMISIVFGEKEQERILLQVQQQVFDEPEDDDDDDDDGKDDDDDDDDADTNHMLLLDVDVSSHEYMIGDMGCRRLLQSLLGLNPQHNNSNNNNNNSPATQSCMTRTRTSSNTCNSYYYIRTLDLETNGLSAEAGKAVAAAIAIPVFPIRSVSSVSVSLVSFFHRLEHLNLGCNNIGPEGCEHLAQQLQHLPYLEILDLHGNGISDRGCLALANAAAALAAMCPQTQTLQALQVLDLSANRIEDAGAAALNRLLFRNHKTHNGCCGCPLLTTLNLRENGIESIAVLVGGGGGGVHSSCNNSSNSSTSTPRSSTSSPRLEQLHTLDVSWNSIGSLEALLTYHDKYPNLTDLDIRGNALPDHECHRLCSQLLLLNGDDTNNHNTHLDDDDDGKNPPPSQQTQIPVPVPVLLPPTGESRLRVCLRLLADDHVTNEGLCRLPLWQWHKQNCPIPSPIPSTTDVPVPLPTIPLPSLPPRPKRNVPVPLPTIPPLPSLPPRAKADTPLPSIPPRAKGDTPLPSIPPRAKGDTLPLPSLPPRAKGFPLPSLPSRSKGDSLPSLPSLPPENNGAIPIPSLPKGDQLDLPPANEFNNANDNVCRSKRPKKATMRLIAAHTSAFDQTPTTTIYANNNDNKEKRVTSEVGTVTGTGSTTTTAADPSESAEDDAVAVRRLRRDGYVIQAPPLATKQTMKKLSTIMHHIEHHGYPPVFCFMHDAFWDFITTHIWPKVTSLLLGVDEHNESLCVLDAGSAFAWSLQATGKSTFPRDGEFRKWQNAVSNVNTTVPKEKDSEAPEGEQGGEHTHNNYRGLGSSFGLPHRDYSAVDSLYCGDDDDDNHNKQHSPAVLTVWIPLNDATTTNGCMYVVPKEFDTDFATTDGRHAHMNPAVEVQRGVSSKIQFPLHGVRALPAPAGSLIAWYGNTIHWGSSCSKYVTDDPRKSMALTFVRSDCSGALSSTTTTTTSTSNSDNDNDDDDGPHPKRIHNPCPPISLRQATTMTARMRLSLISRSLLLYNQWHALADDAVPALIYDTTETTTAPSQKKKTTTTT